MIADKPGGGHKEDSRWLAETLQLTSDGTEYVTPGRIVLPIVTAHSHHLPHLQLADLVVAATTAAVAGRQSGLSLGPLLAKLMHRHKLGDANGAGIVLWPADTTCCTTHSAKPASRCRRRIPGSHCHVRNGAMPITMAWP